MSKTTIIDPVAFFISHAVRLFMDRHEMTIEAFLALDAQKDILGFLKAGYEPFHLTGDEGVLDEMDAYVGNISLEHHD
jgi:hypothetical protein